MARIGEDIFRRAPDASGADPRKVESIVNALKAQADSVASGNVKHKIKQILYMGDRTNGTDTTDGNQTDDSPAGTGGTKGGGYTQDPYAAQANALYKQLMAREPFKYDLQGDMLYRQYADQYSQLGRQAMMDTMGTAAGLTGGYGNSYANAVGNQAYQQYMGQLNAMVPDFYDRAYQRWQDQGNDLLNQYQLALSRVSSGGGSKKNAENETDTDNTSQNEGLPYEALLWDILFDKEIEDQQGSTEQTEGPSFDYYDRFLEEINKRRQSNNE